MTHHYPIVLEHETNGTVSAYVVGVPGVFAAADSEAAAARAIRSALEAHLAAIQSLPGARRPLRGRFTESLLFGARPGDPVMLGAAAAALLSIAALAAYFPARRAARLDPGSALRND